MSRKKPSINKQENRKHCCVRFLKYVMLSQENLFSKLQDGMIPVTTMYILFTVINFFGGQGDYGQAEDPRLLLYDDWKVTPFFLLEGLL